MQDLVSFGPRPTGLQFSRGVTNITLLVCDFAGSILITLRHICDYASIVYLSLISFSNGSHRRRHGGSARAGWEVSFSNPFHLLNISVQCKCGCCPCRCPPAQPGTASWRTASWRTACWRTASWRTACWRTGCSTSASPSSSPSPKPPPSPPHGSKLIY